MSLSGSAIYGRPDRDVAQLGVFNMALPAILGVTAIAGFFTSLFTKIIDHFVLRNIEGIIRAGLLIAAVVAVVSTALTLIGSKLLSLLSSFPMWPPELIPLFFPATVAKYCLLTVITVEIIVTYSTWSIWLYKLVKRSKR